MICSKDDSGDCCGKCFNPVVIMATHERVKVTTMNVKQLLSMNLKVVLVCSKPDEAEEFKNLGVTVIIYPNKPLGAKWQAGVNVAGKMNADPFIILGSDDFISNEYLKIAYQKLSEGYHFIGLTSWYTWDDQELIRCEYINRNTDFPIGSGRFYSAECIRAIRGKVFDSSVDKHLDDRGFFQVNNNNLKVYLHRDPEILAYKGKWPVMNSPQAYKRSMNIKTKTERNRKEINRFLCVE